jgi:hypothetical protein
VLALALVAVATAACGRSHRAQPTPPPTTLPVNDVTGLGIAVYAPPDAYRGTLARDPLPTGARTGVAVYGDSLTAQAWDYVESLARYGGHRLSGNRLSGSALCDWNDDLARTLRDVRPAYIVVAFAGNNGTPCVAGLTGRLLEDKYEADARAVVERARAVGTHVVFVGPPDMLAAYMRANAMAARDAYEKVAVEADSDDVDFVDSRDTLSIDGYTPTTACTPWETPLLGCKNGMIPIRLADGVHWSQPEAHGYSGGAWRWAADLFREVRPAANALAAHD